MSEERLHRRGTTPRTFEQASKKIDDILRKDAGVSSELDYIEQTSWLLFLKYPLLEELRGYWRWMKPKTFLFPGLVDGWRADVPITDKMVWFACQRATRAAGIEKHISPHTLRHSYQPSLISCLHHRRRPANS